MATMSFSMDHGAIFTSHAGMPVWTDGSTWHEDDGSKWHEECSGNDFEEQAVACSVDQADAVAPVAPVVKTSGKKKPRRRGGKRNKAEVEAASTYEAAWPARAWSSAEALGKSFDHCNEVRAELMATAPGASDTAFFQILPILKVLAMAKHGTRVVQTAIEVSDISKQVLIVEQLEGSIVELYRSPHGNYVVSKMIEVMPPAQSRFILDELKGGAVAAAKHQYGCRVLERLIEHFAETSTIEVLIEELLEDPEPICRHPYGNFVMQHIFEHGLPSWKDRIIKDDTFRDMLPSLAKHRTASHVIQRALDRGSSEIQEIIFAALLGATDENSLVNVSCTRYGSFVVEELVNFEVARVSVCEALGGELSRLAADPFGRRVLDRFFGNGYCNTSGKESELSLPSELPARHL